MQLTFGETLCEVCEPFSDYQGWLSSSWLQQQDLWLDVLPAAIDLPRRYCFRYLKVEVKAVSEKFRLRLNQIQVNAVTSATQTCPPAVTTDPQLQAIDRVAVLTLKNCMQEVFEDGRNVTAACGSGIYACRRWSMMSPSRTTIWSAAVCTCLPVIPGKTGWCQPTFSSSRTCWLTIPFSLITLSFFRHSL